MKIVRIESIEELNVNWNWNKDNGNICVQEIGGIMNQLKSCDKNIHSVAIYIFALKFWIIVIERKEAVFKVTLQTDYDFSNSFHILFNVGIFGIGNWKGKLLGVE